MWTRPNRAKKYFHLAVQFVYSFVELDVPAAQYSANYDATFHFASIAEMRGDGHGPPQPAENAANMPSPMQPRELLRLRATEIG